MFEQSKNIEWHANLNSFEQIFMGSGNWIIIAEFTYIDADNNICEEHLWVAYDGTYLNIYDHKPFQTDDPVDDDAALLRSIDAAELCVQHEDGELDGTNFDYSLLIMMINYRAFKHCAARYNCYIN